MLLVPAAGKTSGTSGDNGIGSPVAEATGAAPEQAVAGAATSTDATAAVAEQAATRAAAATDADAALAALLQDPAGYELLLLDIGCDWLEPEPDLLLRCE
jgi:hypothetical protein